MLAYRKTPLNIIVNANWTGLPQASTCNNAIFLPLHSNKGELEKKLLFAIEHCTELVNT